MLDENNYYKKWKYGVSLTPYFLIRDYGMKLKLVFIPIILFFNYFL